MQKLTNILIIGILFSVIIAIPLAAESLPVRLVTGIETQGNQIISTDEILQQVKSKVGEPLNTDQVQKDMQTVYDTGYFDNVQMDVKNHLGGVKLIFVVKENPLLTKIEISGSSLISISELLAMMSSKSGMILNHNTLYKDIQSIESAFQKQGWLLAHVQSAAVSPEGLLSIVIHEGVINGILIEGNDKTRDYVIRREMKVQSGDIFKLDQVQTDVRKIYNLGFFESVEPSIEQVNDGSGKVNLVYELREKKTGQYLFGGMYSTKDGWMGYVDLQEKNLFGRGQNVGFRWEFGQSTNYELSFYDPWLIGNRFSFGADIYNTTNRTGKEVDGTKYTKYTQGAGVKIGKYFTNTISGSVKFKYENSRISWEENVKPEEIGDTRSLVLTGSHDTTDNPFSPHSGSREVVSLQYAGQLLGGSYHFTKLSFDFTRYFSGFRADHTWAVRTKGGFGLGQLPSHEMYRLGGSETLRGFAPSSFSGDKMLLGNLEYRFPIVKMLEGSVFVDSGRAWESGERINFGELKTAVGAGLLMETPVGQIRIGYAWGIGEKSGMPYFGIGQTF